jgi:hypothetical protein
MKRFNVIASDLFNNYFYIEGNSEKEVYDQVLRLQVAFEFVTRVREVKECV